MDPINIKQGFQLDLEIEDWSRRWHSVGAKPFSHWAFCTSLAASITGARKNP